MKFIVFIFFIVCLLGCKKVKFTSDQEKCVGDYEWAYSTSEMGPTVSQNEIADFYGIRIKDKTRLTIYKNGKKEITGFITGIYSYNKGYKLKFESNENLFYFIFENEMLMSTDYPLEGYKNFYIRK